MQCTINTSEDLMFGKMERMKHVVFVYVQQISNGLQMFHESEFQAGTAHSGDLFEPTRALPTTVG